MNTPFAHRNLPRLLLQARESVMAHTRPSLRAHALSDQQWRVLRVLGEHGVVDTGRVAREGRLTAASAAEQAGAGLAALTPAEIARFDADNGAYRERFGFPFVICARENTKDSILAALAHRRNNERAAEIATALGEIAKIAKLRIEDAVN